MWKLKNGMTKNDDWKWECTYFIWNWSNPTSYCRRSKHQWKSGKYQWKSYKILTDELKILDKKVRLCYLKTKFMNRLYEDSSDHSSVWNENYEATEETKTGMEVMLNDKDSHDTLRNLLKLNNESLDEMVPKEENWYRNSWNSQIWKKYNLQKWMI